MLSNQTLRKLNTNVVKVMLIMFFSSLYIYSHIGTLYMQARGLSLLQIGSITSVILIVTFAAEVPTGVLADHIGRKWSVVLGIFLQALGEWLYYFSSSYLTFVLIAILAGIGFAFLSGTLEALVYDSLNKDDDIDRDMEKAMGKVGGAHQLGFVLSPILGTMIVYAQEIPHYRNAILATAISVTIALIVSLTLREPGKDYRHSEISPFKTLKSGISLIRKDIDLKKVVLTSVTTLMFTGYLHTYYQPYFLQNGVNVLWVGYALSVAALLSVVAQNLSHYIKNWLGYHRSIVVLTLTPALLYIALGVSGGTPFLVVALFILIYGLSSMRDPIFSAYQNKYIPSESRSTTLSLINMLRNSLTAVGGVILGYISQYSLSFMFIVIGVYIAVAFLCVAYFNGRSENKGKDLRLV